MLKKGDFKSRFLFVLVVLLALASFSIAQLGQLGVPSQNMPCNARQYQDEDNNNIKYTRSCSPDEQACTHYCQLNEDYEPIFSTCTKQCGEFVCPIYECAAPPAGCSYESSVDENGCRTCGKLVCQQKCTTDSDCPQLVCIRAPCPQYSCINGQCKLSTCGNGICEKGEADYCPPCVYDPIYPCEAPCTKGTCQQDCGSEISDNVKCVFNSSTSAQECYSEKGRCKGVESCGVGVSGKKGEQITWKSSCGGYAYTTIDGDNDYAFFNCKAEPACTDSDGGKDYYVKGYITSPKFPDQTFYDSCFAVNEGNYKTLVELFCDRNNDIQKEYYDCPNGCKDGACIKGCIDYTAEECLKNDNCQLVSVRKNGQKCIDFVKCAEKPDLCAQIDCSKFANNKLDCIVYDKCEYAKGKCAEKSQPSITVLSPNGGESWQPSSQVTIKWDASNLGSGSIGINLMKDNVDFQTIGTVPNTGYYVWTVPSDTIFSGSNFKIKVMIVSGESIVAQDTSDAPFSIVSSAQCSQDSDCPQIACIRAPCPQYSCINGQCKLSTCGNGICEEGEKECQTVCTECPTYRSEASPPNIPCGGCQEVCEYKCQQDCEKGKCTDSDNGINQYVRGKAVGPDYGGVKGIIWGEDSNKCSARNDNSLDYSVHYDCCSDVTQNKQLNEAYCDNGKLLSTGIQCEFGCSDGACIQKPTCTDSDNGNDIYVKGTATSNNNIVIDYCIDESNVNEAVCLKNGIIGVYTYGCSNGCKDGACIKSPQEQTFRNAEWVCADGYKESQGEPTSCKTTDLWLTYAGKSCAGRCSGICPVCIMEPCPPCTTICGISYFSVNTAC